MDRHIIILTIDKRQEFLGRLLPGRYQTCSWENYRREEICEKIYVLPTPVGKMAQYPRISEQIREELINAKGPLFVFGGAITGEWKEFLEKNGIAYLDFMQLPEVVEGNAVITAEGTVAEILRNSDRSVCEQKILVTGYGCCGKPIASLLRAMGAEVVVAARRSAVRQEIESDGFRAISFDDLPCEAAPVAPIINTVPALVVTEEVLEKMSEDALVIDIASKPGGTDFEAALRLGIRAKLALGLPGIYTTGSSAGLLADAISKYAPLQKDVKEDRQWIFQIII